MADNFSSHMKGLDAPADKHWQIAASADPLDPKPRSVRCQVAGTLTIVDEAGTSLDYAMAVGEVLPFRPYKVTAISSGTFYGWE